MSTWIPEDARILDISPLLSPRLAVYPGDEPFARREDLSWERGDFVQLSTITTSLHLGAHADAPRHFHPEGRSMEEIDLHPYLGRCQVVQLDLPRRSRVHPGHLRERGIEIEAPRVLFRTDSYPDPEQWNEDFVALAPELIDHLADSGVRLVGLDTPSVDLGDSLDLVTHARLHARNMANLESLRLNQVPPGLYTLIALPLRIAKADGSPVRAVLLA